MSDNPVLSDKDRALFRRAVAGALVARREADSLAVAASQPVSPPVASPGSPKAPSGDDLAMFQKAMQGVTPLVVDRQAVQRRRPPPLPLRLDGSMDDFPADESSGAYASLFDTREVVPEVLWFQRAGLQHLLLRKLRRGRVPVEAELDLHGMIVAEARPAVDRFLIEAGDFGLRCVRIIHGKGTFSPERRPVLKGLVNRWLRERDEVLAFSSAPPEDGGTGAVHVLLRRGGR